MSFISNYLNRRSSKQALTARGQKTRIVMHAKASARADIRDAITALRNAGHAIEVRLTYEAGDAEFYAAEAALDNSIGTVVAGGGDGTANAVVSGLMTSSAADLPTLGLLPLGTANDFANACELSSLNALQLITTAVTGSAKSIDVGQVNERYFLNVATGGFGTEITVATPENLKSLLGGAAYLITGISRPSAIRAYPLTVSGDNFEWQGDFLALAVGNARFAGGGVPMCDSAVLDDGLLDLTVLPDITYSDLPDALALITEHGLTETALRKRLITRRSPVFTLSAEQAFQLNLDGEPMYANEFNFCVHPGVIRMRLPSTTHILKGDKPRPLTTSTEAT